MGALNSLCIGSLSNAHPLDEIVAKGPLKLLFLDVDGVLNDTRGQFSPDASDFSMFPLHTRKIQHLVSIVAATDALVVLSSAWRLIPSAKNVLMRRLSSEGIVCIGDTPDLSESGCYRTAEINVFLGRLKANYSNVKIDSWIAIDDLPLHRMDYYLMKGHFVNTLPEVGLTKQNVNQCIRLLNANNIDIDIDENNSNCNGIKETPDSVSQSTTKSKSALLESM